MDAETLGQALAAYGEAVANYQRAVEVYAQALLALDPGTRVILLRAASTVPAPGPAIEAREHVTVMGGLVCRDCGAFLEHLCPDPAPAEAPAA